MSQYHKAPIGRPTLGKAIRRIRVCSDLNQTEFSRKYGLDQTILSRWEGGTRIPNRDVLAEIAKIGAKIGLINEASVLFEAAKKAPKPRRSFTAEYFASVIQRPVESDHLTTSLNDSIAPSAEVPLSEFSNSTNRVAVPSTVRQPQEARNA
jgi:transcriptional regulator with XRE-family HTH domain